MASDTKNVKLGVCKVSFGGVDLGYTIGGVDVTVKTDTHKVMVDQFGKTPINEYIMGRQVTVKCPLAESTLINFAQALPGSVVVMEGGVKAAGVVTITTNPTTGQTILVNGRTITFRTIGVLYANEVTLGATAATTATALGAFFAATSDTALNIMTAGVVGAAVTLTAAVAGAAANAIALVTGTAAAAVTMTTATLIGGVDGTVARVDVSPNVSANLLDFAKLLTLHPVAKNVLDLTDDFTLFRAAADGNVNFSYKLDGERVYTATFNGYPDATTGKLFAMGDTTAP